MKCPHCAARVAPESVFCHRCGERLSTTADTPRQTLLSQVHAGSTASAASAEQDAAESDRVLWQGSYSAKDMVSSWLLAGLLTVVLPLLLSFTEHDPRLWWILAGVLMLVWLGPLAVLAWRKLSVSFLLTTTRLVHQRGVLTRYTQRLELIDIDDVSYRQGLIERILGVGTIVIHSSDCTDPVLTMRGIDQVPTVASTIDDARRAERSRRGLYVESI